MLKYGLIVFFSSVIKVDIGEISSMVPVRQKLGVGKNGGFGDPKSSQNW